MRVLVGFASQHGSTRSIAERIAARLGEHGIQIDARPLDQVLDAGVYDAVVAGSAIHQQTWLPEAVAFVRREADTLSRRPTWLFSVGIASALRGPFRGLLSKQEPAILASLGVAVHPRDHHIFAGLIRPEHLPPAGRILLWLFVGRGGDFRSWPEVDAWAARIAEGLTGTARPVLTSAGGAAAARSPDGS